MWSRSVRTQTPAQVASAAAQGAGSRPDAPPIRATVKVHLSHIFARLATSIRAKLTLVGQQVKPSPLLGHRVGLGGNLRLRFGERRIEIVPAHEDLALTASPRLRP